MIATIYSNYLEICHFEIPRLIVTWILLYGKKPRSSIEFQSFYTRVIITSIAKHITIWQSDCSLEENSGKNAATVYWTPEACRGLVFVAALLRRAEKYKCLDLIPDNPDSNTEIFESREVNQLLFVKIIQVTSRTYSEIFLFYVRISL